MHMDTLQKEIYFQTKVSVSILYPVHEHTDMRDQLLLSGTKKTNVFVVVILTWLCQA